MICCLTASTLSRSLSNSSRSGADRSGRAVTFLLGQVLQTVHLAELVRFLLARQEWDFVEASDLRADAVGHPVTARRRDLRVARHRGEDRVAGGGVIEAGVGDVLDPRAEGAEGLRPAGQAPWSRRR